MLQAERGRAAHWLLMLDAVFGITASCPHESQRLSYPRIPIIRAISYPLTLCVKHPHVYQGAVIATTRRKDGSVQPHFKPAPRKMPESSYKKYAWLVRDELMEAFKIAEADKKAEDEKMKGFEEDEPQPFGY